MAESSSEPKCMKPEPNDDRISSLPDTVLLHILSFLPTKASVITGLLSRRWRHLWKDLQVFDFDDEGWDFDHGDDVIDICRGFAAFVNAVLVLRRSRDIQSFSLKCAQEHSGLLGAKSVAMWVSAAIGPHLQELHLWLDCRNEHDLVVPHDLFLCTKLKSLNLRGAIRVQVPSTVRLLSLKALYLNVHSVDSIDSLLSECPVLESLDLSFIFPVFDPIVKVIGPSTLKKLTMRVSSFYGTKLEIYAPSLEYLSMINVGWGSPSSLSIESFHNMMEAKLDMFVEHESVDVLVLLLRAICKTKTMVLGRSTTEHLLLSPSLELPQFHYLVHLELKLPWFKSSFLLTMLQQCNMLQVLNIGIRNYQEPAVLQRWSQPTDVPDCLVSHLNFFKFEGYEGNEDELAFVGYILQNGLVLETMIIDAYILDLEERLHILQDLCVRPRGSNICQLRFS